MQRVISVVTEAMPMLLKGMELTIQITFLGVIIAFVIGMATCLMRISKVKLLCAVAGVYIYIIRGTPMLVQAFFLYFGVAGLLPFTVTKITVGVVTISLNAGAYMAEIFRGSIQSVSKGQMEAARSLGLPYGKAMSKVILPQALRRSIPSLTNQIIISLKDVSLLSAIGVAEIFQAGKIITARNMESTIIWATVGVIYLVVVFVLTKASVFIEGRTSYDKGSNKKSA